MPDRCCVQAAKKPEFKLNLGDLIKFGRDADRKTLLMSAMFLQKELPIRIGKRVQELQVRRVKLNMIKPRERYSISLNPSAVAASAHVFDKVGAGTRGSL